jgi:hypothetical protein
MQANGAGMKAAYAAVKSEADYQKRKTVDSQQVCWATSLQAGAGHFEHRAAGPHPRCCRCLYCLPAGQAAGQQAAEGGRECA